MTPSLGTIVVLPILLLLAAAATIVSAQLWRHRKNARPSDRFLCTAGPIVGWAVAAAVVVGCAIGMWPYSGEYHTWRATTGTVKAVDSRMVADGDGMTQRFVVTYTDGQQRACDDTRCATVKAGDRLSLKCKRAYQWGATPGWDCNWIGNRRRPA